MGESCSLRPIFVRSEAVNITWTVFTLNEKPFFFHFITGAVSIVTPDRLFSIKTWMPQTMQKPFELHDVINYSV